MDASSCTQFCFLTSCFYSLKESESIRNEAVDLMERSCRNTTIQEAVFCLCFYLALTGWELKNSKCTAYFYDMTYIPLEIIIYLLWTHQIIIILHKTIIPQYLVVDRIQIAHLVMIIGPLTNHTL